MISRATTWTPAGMNGINSAGISKSARVLAEMSLLGVAVALAAPTNNAAVTSKTAVTDRMSCFIC